MRAILIVALLLLALGLSGCPGGGGSSSGDKSSSIAEAQSSGAEPTAGTGDQSPDRNVATPETGSDVSAPTEDIEPTAEGQEVGDGDANSGENHAEASSEGNAFELEGLRLDISPDSYRVYYNSRTSAVLTSNWMKEEQTGIIATNLQDNTRYFNELAYFLDGELVGVMRDREESIEEYADFTNELERRYGPPGEKPPRWARVTPFFFGYQEAKPGLIMKFWGNSHMRQVLFAARNNEIGATSYVLCDVDRFDAVAESMQPPPPPEQ